MPISRKDFEKGNFYGRNVKGDKNHPVYHFLLKNKNEAFTYSEISEHVKRSKYTIIATLKRMIKKGMVKYKSPYYMINLRKVKKKRR